MEIKTGLWMDPPDGRRWFFDSGALSLDLGYTGDYGYGVAAWESLHGPADLDSWLADRFGPPARPCGETDLAGARRLRAAITATARRVSTGEPPAATDVDVINDWAARPAIPPRLPGGTGKPVAPGPAEMLATVAHDAIRTFGSMPDRVRECAADDCRLIFLDTSRPGSRRWCSMRRCGGRAKAKTHYHRNH
ncbi:CGNR zinc finger domain-containing protein [Microlunatus speluncae]|uniref:CGNR zinc finger domain-containing protein n=1 Tax=Microlunatus speluncae TaxID=2594267 RepID=UPI001C2D4E38|nr:CGNR zinc finger domain-containing protein [Microlunatus speluncae]